MVVAPTALSSPRAKAGFNILEASMEPSEAPVPTKVCSSSMNKIILPPWALISFKTAFNRSSNSPRNFEPATKAPRSRLINSLPFRVSGTSPATILCAKPSTMAVLPVPASPIKTGLFLVRRDSTCIMRLISSSRPITGSSFSCLACSVKLMAYFSKTRNFDSGSGSVMVCEPRSFKRIFKTSA